MNYILFDDQKTNLLPLTFCRPVSEIRVGILTLRDKWEKYLGQSCSYLTDEYLKEKYPCKILEDNILVNGSIVPNPILVQEILKLQPDQYLVKANVIIAARLTAEKVKQFSNQINHAKNFVQFEEKFIQICNTYDIFTFNGICLQDDFQLITHDRKSQPLSNTNGVICPENIFIEEGAKIEYAILNASEGPIYIAKNAEIMEGSLIRGPFAICEKSQVKMGAKIYGPTTIGPGSKVAGELNNVVFFGNSNKAHDGFLGNSVISEWCNLGAGTNNSNLKNNYAEVKLWNYTYDRFMPTNMQFCGLIMGDHSKCGINTMFNTGTVVGVSANIFGAGYPRNFIPSFSWGGYQGLSIYPFNKAIETAEKVLSRRGFTLSETDKNILHHIFIITEKYRRF